MLTLASRRLVAHFARIGAAAMLLAPAAASAGAVATTMRMQIDPARSTLEVVPEDTAVSMTFGSPFGPITVEIASQGPGDTLPGGQESDGLMTSLSGDLVVGHDADSIWINPRRSRFQLDTSGSYLPGLPGDEETEAAADLAWRIDEQPFGPLMEGSIRGAWATVDLPPTSLLGGPSLFTFDAQQAFLELLLGYVDVFSPLDCDARFELGYNDIVPQNQGGTGTLQQLPTGYELTMPIDVSFDLTPDDFVTAAPAHAALRLRGEIVATSVPEPGPTLCAAAAALTLAFQARRRQRRRVVAPPRSDSNLERTIAVALLAVTVGTLGCPSDKQLRALDPDSMQSGSGAGLAGGGSGAPVVISNIVCEQEDLRVSTRSGLNVDEVMSTNGCPDTDEVSVMGTINGNDHTVTGRYAIEPFTNGLREAFRLVAECGLETGPSGALVPGGPFCRSKQTFGFDVATGDPAEPPLLYAVLTGSVVGDGTTDGFVDGDISCPGYGADFDADDVFIVDPSGDGHCTANLELSGSMSFLGQTVRRATLVVFSEATMCEGPSFCPAETPFCSGICHDGGEGNPCRHDIECASPLYCGSGGTCQDGSSGDACDLDADCTMSGVCGSGVCL